MNGSASIAALVPALERLAALDVEPSITRAARRAGTSQPTLSRAIHLWERELGIAVVRRRGRSGELTDDGRHLASAAVAALTLLEAAVARVRPGHDGRVRHDARGRRGLTVGYLRSLGPTAVAELVSSYLSEHPRVVVAHREASSSDLLDQLDAGEVDVAVSAPRPPDRFSWLPLGRQAIVLLVPTVHRLAARSSVALVELDDEPFLALDSRFHTRQLAERLCAAAGVRPRVVLEADNLVTVANYVAAGLGVAVVPADLTVHPRTATVTLADPGAHRDIGLVWRATDDRGPARQFVEHAMGLNARYPRWADIGV